MPAKNELSILRQIIFSVALLARELNIRLDGIVFPELMSNTVSKSVVDFFSGRSEIEAQKYSSHSKAAMSPD